MPIEFRCTSCDKLLRTPDDSAGKNAKCPQCGGIVAVPLASPTESIATLPPTESPFAEIDASERLVSSAGSGSPNPYASPQITAPLIKEQQSTADLSHHLISFDEVLRMSWELVQNQLGQIALCGLLYLAIVLGANIAVGAVGAVGQAVNEPGVQIVGQVLSQVVGFVVNSYLQLGLLIFGLRLVRTGTPRVSDLFAVKPFLWRGLGLFLMITIIYYAVMIVCLAPAFGTLLTEQQELIIPAFVLCVLLGVGVGVYAILRMALAGAFLVDRDVGVMESLRLSDQFMTGNKLTTLLLGIVTGIIGMFFVLITCCLGSVVVTPFMLGVLIPTVYLQATGQTTYRSVR